MRAIWSGEIAFGLVAIPAKLYSATKDLTPSFSQLHKTCGSRINMVRRCTKCAIDVPWEEVGKGYEVSKGQYALFTKEELAKLEGDEGASGIDIAEFIDLSAIDIAFFEKSYWVGPAGKSSRGFMLLKRTLEETGKVALAKVKLRARTRLGVLRPKGKLFSLDVMRYGDELVMPDDIDVPDTSKEPNERELKLALDLVAQLAATFDPERHPDQYRAAVSAAVEQKVEANELKDGGAEAAVEAQGAQVIDLAEMLARSLRTMSASNDEPKPGPKKAPQEEAAAEPVAEKPAKKKRAAGTK